MSSPLAWFPFTFPFSMTGQPAISVPCGWTQDGLPVGLQIVGRRFAMRLCSGWRASEKKLNTLAKALNARPALRRDISGRVDPEYDREGLHYAMLDRLIKEQKINEQANKGENVNPADVEVTQADYDKYLKRVYKATKFERPRNFLGLDKSLPPDEMKKLLLAQMKITDADLKRLADKRAEVVRRQLAQHVDPARLFVVVPKLNAEGIEGKGKTTRVDLSLD